MYVYCSALLRLRGPLIGSLSSVRRNEQIRRGSRERRIKVSHGHLIGKDQFALQRVAPPCYPKNVYMGDNFLSVE